MYNYGEGGGGLQIGGHVKGGGRQAEKVLAMLKGGKKGFSSLKGGPEMFYPVLGGGGAQKVSDP